MNFPAAEDLLSTSGEHRGGRSGVGGLERLIASAPVGDGREDWRVDWRMDWRFIAEAEAIPSTLSSVRLRSAAFVGWTSVFSVRQRCFVEPSIYVCVCGAFGVVGARISVALRWTAGASGSIASPRG